MLQPRTPAWRWTSSIWQSFKIGGMPRTSMSARKSESTCCSKKVPPPPVAMGLGIALSLLNDKSSHRFLFWRRFIPPNFVRRQFSARTP